MAVKNIRLSYFSSRLNFFLLPVLQRITRFEWRLVAILLLALWIRLGYVPEYGHVDLDAFYDWAVIIRDHGLFDIYHLETFYPYPPIYFISLDITNRITPPIGQVLSDDVGLDPPYLRLLKLFPILSGLSLITAVYLWLPRGSRLRWMIPAVMAVYPGLILSSAFWGQLDAPMTLFLALALMALNRDRPLWTWAWFALAMMTKFQSIVIAPLLLLLCLRRYGLRRTTGGLTLGAVIGLAMMAPFIVVSGARAVLAPFIAAVDVYPVTTAYAFNLWYAGIPAVWDIRPPNTYPLIDDGNTLFNLLTYKQAGFVMLGLFALLVCVHAWRYYRERREFIWAGAMYFAFFMLPTQMHERYLHPAALFLLFGIVQDRRLWLPAAGLAFSYSYNLLSPISRPFYWLGIDWMFVLGDVSLHVALLNLLMLARVTWIMLRPPVAAEADGGEAAQTERGRRFGRVVWAISGLAAGLLVVAMVLHVVIPDQLPREAEPINIQFVQSARLEGHTLTRRGDDWHVALYWRAINTIDNDFSVFVYAEKDGQNIAHCDELPQRGAYPTWRWFRNRLVETTCWLLLPPGMTPDRITVGLLDQPSMMRLQVVENGQVTSHRQAVVWEAQ